MKATWISCCSCGADIKRGENYEKVPADSTRHTNDQFFFGSHHSLYTYFVVIAQILSIFQSLFFLLVYACVCVCVCVRIMKVFTNLNLMRFFTWVSYNSICLLFVLIFPDREGFFPPKCAGKVAIHSPLFPWNILSVSGFNTTLTARNCTFHELQHNCCSTQTVPMLTARSTLQFKRHQSTIHQFQFQFNPIQIRPLLKHCVVTLTRLCRVVP